MRQRGRNGAAWRGSLKRERCAIITGSFWDFARIKDFQFPESATSSQIQEEAKALWPEEPLEEFHALYQRIRYGSYPETETEKRRAKELYRQFSGKDLRE